MQNDKITTLYSQHQAGIMRLAATEGNKVIPYLDAIEAGIQAILKRNRNKPLTAQRQKDMIAEMNKVSRENLQAYVQEFRADNRVFAEYEAEFSTGIVNDVIESPGVVASAPSTSSVVATAVAKPIKIGEKSFTTYSKMMSGYWRKYSDAIDGNIRSAFMDGTSTADVAANIAATIWDGKDSTLEKARRGARTLTNTGMTHMSSSAREAMVADNEDLIIGYRFIATLDSNTSSTCRAGDQQVYKKTDPNLSSFRPPRHPNCRSSWVPEVDGRYRVDLGDSKRASSFEEGGEYKTNDDGQRTGGVEGARRDPKPVSSKQTYYDEMSKLKAADQDNILGPTMGRAFRKMGNADDFAKATVDTLGNPLTITEMKQKDDSLGRILRAQE